MSTLLVENIKHEDATDIAIVLGSDGTLGIGTVGTARNDPLTVKGLNNIAKFESSAAAVELRIATPTIDKIGLTTGTNDNFFINVGGSDRLYVASGGNVGIGTDIPSNKLEVHHGDTYKFSTRFNQGNNNYATGFGQQQSILAYSGNGSGGTEEYYAGITFGLWDGLTGSKDGTIHFHTANDGTVTTNLMIDDSGNVGIGTTSPLDKLTVRSTDSNLHSTTLTKGTNTKGVWVINSNNSDDMMGIHMGSDNGTHFSSIVGARTASGSHWGTHLGFYTHSENTSGLNTATERMRITGDGEITMPYQPVCSTTHGPAVNLSNVILTSSNFYDTIHVNRGGHFNSSNGRFTCPVGGVYRIYFRATGTGNSNVRLRKNGSTVNEAYEATGTNHSVSSEAVVNCAAGDYLEIQVARLETIGGTQHKQVTFEFLG